MREKSIQMPPRVEASAPGRLVPPENEVTGMRRREHICIMLLTSEVVSGRRMRAGSRSAAGDHGLLEREAHFSMSDMTFVESRNASSSSRA